MTTPRLGAPELTLNQATPETTVNETFYWLDAASMGGFAVIDRDLSTPPGSPAQGDCYILSGAGSGGWAGGSADDVALYINTAWEIRTPDDGWEAYVIDEGVKIAFTSGAWGIIGTFDGASYVPTAGGTMTGDLIVPDEAYDATAWNGSLEVPTKNAVRDKIETLAGSIPGAYTDEQAQDAVGTIFTDTGLAVVTYSDATPSIDVNVPAAVASDFRTGTDATKALTADAVWDAADYVALTDAATVAVDMSTGINFSLTIGGNRTLGAPSNTKNGQTGCIVITQDGTGSRTLAYHANWKFAGGTDPTLSTAAGAVDILFYQVISSTSIYANLVKAIA